MIFRDFKKLYIVLILLVIPFSNSADLIFSETFGSANFSYQDLCAIVGQGIGSYSNYSDGFSIGPGFDNPDWSCIADQSTSTDLIHNLSDASINTEQGIRMFRGSDACTGNCETGFGHIFEESFSLTNNTEISFYCSNFNVPAGANPAIFLLFGDTENIKFTLALNDVQSGNDCSLSDTPPNCCQVQSLIGNKCTSGTAVQVVFNMSGLQTQCSSVNASSIQNLNYFAFQSVGPSSEVRIDDIEFNYFNGTNDLPSVTLSIDNPIDCVNTSRETNVFNITIETRDRENDTILYSIGESSRKNFNLSVTYDQLSCSGIFKSSCTNNPNFDFLENTLFRTSNTCRITDTFPPLNLTNFMLFEDFSDDGYKLYMHNDCVGSDKSFYYGLSDPLDNLFYASRITEFKEGYNINISFYDVGFGNEISRLIYRKTSGNITVFTWNGTAEVQLMNRLLQFSDDLFIDIKDLEINNNRATVILPNTLGTEANFTLLRNDTRIAIIALSIGNGTKIFQDGFDISGSLLRPVFSTTRPNNISLTGIGSKTFTVFVTDDINNPNHVLTSIEVTNVDCDFFIGETVSQRQLRAFGILRNTIQTTCDIFDNTVNNNDGFGTCFFLYGFYLFISFIITLFVSTGFAILNKSIGLSAFGIVFSIFAWFGSFFFNTGRNLTFIFILIAVFSLMNLVRTLYFGNRSLGISNE